MTKLSDLPNIGKEIERQLHEVGINTYEDLVNTGSTEAWLKIKQIDPSACVNRLRALEGAIQKVRWHDLSDSDKEYLQTFYENSKNDY